MSAASMAGAGLVFVCLSAIAAMLFGAMASINNPDPGDRGFTALGHRVVTWVSVALLFGLAAVLALEGVAS